MGFKFCPMCGEKLINQSFKFCPECGYNMDSEEESHNEILKFKENIGIDSPVEEETNNTTIILENKEESVEHSNEVPAYIAHLVREHEKKEEGKPKKNTLPSAEESRARIKRNKAKFLKENDEFEKEVDKSLAQVHAIMASEKTKKQQEDGETYGSFPCFYSEKRYNTIMGIYPEFFDGTCTVTKNSLVIQGKKRQKIIRFSNISSIEYNKKLISPDGMELTLSGGNIIHLSISPQAFDIINQLWSQGDY